MLSAQHWKCQAQACELASLSLFKDCRPDPPVQPLPQLLGSCPRDMVLVVRVEVEPANLILPAAPNHRAAQPHREPGFVVHSRPLPGEVCHHEFAVADLRDDLVWDLIVVLLTVNPNRREARFFDSRFDSAVVCCPSHI